ncbi:MAG: ATP-binding cassette domain-containing protein [Bacteroidales bacterium]|jgi:ABC-2 type transport system ATP-binding protein|nr:ATP-binding cassette domain-containing protein [Bacteroidales bacterium]MCU0407849.1 ATP-binding cassette domain-containing protein [Bacteroidales bacterium]
MALFEARNVTKQYGNQLALDNVSISVPEKCIYGLLGPNGAGKTTLIRIINQITGPDSGELFIDGRKLLPSDVQYIGYLPEERGLYKKMKVGEQALYLAQLKGLSKAEAMKRLRYWFRKLEITDWWGKKIEELSKGMAQKVQFVTTVLHEPKLLIFDEPFTGFDPVNAHTIKNEILFLRERGATIIFSTHNMESVEELCDNITLINKAKTILEGSVDEIRNKWAGNEYDLVFAGDVSLNGNHNFSVLDTKKDNGKSSIRLRCAAGTETNQIVSHALEHGNLISFNPALPSMNEIFIRVVESGK